MHLFKVSLYKKEQPHELFSCEFTHLTTKDTVSWRLEGNGISVGSPGGSRVLLHIQSRAQSTQKVLSKYSIRCSIQKKWLSRSQQQFQHPRRDVSLLPRLHILGAAVDAIKMQSDWQKPQINERNPGMSCNNSQVQGHKSDLTFKIGNLRDRWNDINCHSSF